MRTRIRLARNVCVVSAAAVIALAPAATAGATGSHEAVVSPPIVSGLAGPLQFEVSHGRILVGQSFSGTVSRVDRDGSVTDLFNEPGTDGVASGLFGSTITTFTDGVGPDAPPGSVPQGELRLHTRSGRTITIADLHAFEEKHNPDGDQQYGFQDLSDECAAQLPPDAGILPYDGIAESHPYAIASTFGGWYVADAGANTILFVSWFGTVHAVATLPPQPPVVLSAEAAAANELPPCVAGSSYVAEGVPTDVEIGRNGLLYVSALPGGPEDPSLGARGAVYTVNPWTHRVRRIGSGLAGAANVAVSPRGTVYVSELFGGQVSRLVNGHPVPVAQVDSPSGLEWSEGKLYAGIGTFGPGQIVTIQP
ncbi:MAG: ScyD/ScyE family protein [Acidimicrobiales bacterium]|nr:ScyD/ScyE family protein [Acidimicrobiales bacterium]